MLALAGTIASGALYFFPTGLEGFRPLVWIAPIPVLLISLRSSWWLTAGLALSAYMLGGLNLVNYLARLAPIGVVVGSLIIPGIAFAFAVLAYRGAVVHVKHPFSFIAFPVVWTSFEYLLSSVSPHGTAGSISYTQSGFLPLIQISSLTGIWGITFVLTLLPAGVATAWPCREDKKRSSAMLLGSLLAGIVSILYGWIRLETPESGQPIRVGLVAIDSAGRYFETTNRMQALSVIGSYARQMENLADQGARVAVLPEKIIGVTDAYEGDVYNILGEVAKRRSMVVVAGFSRIHSLGNRNVAAVFSPDGNLVAEYDKVFLLPGAESEFQSGTKPMDFSVSGLSAGVAICTASNILAKRGGYD
jgi:apolipoprotein N-acyltransferase